MSLNKNRDLTFVLKLSFYVYVISFWLRMVFLGKQLSVLETPGEAVSIMQSSQVFLVKVIRVFMSTKKAWYFAIWPILKEISIPYVVLCYTWISLDDQKLFTRLSLTVIFPSFVLLGVIFALRQNSPAQGLLVAHYLGYAMMGISLVMALAMLFSLIKEKKTLENI